MDKWQTITNDLRVNAYLEELKGWAVMYLLITIKQGYLRKVAKTKT